MIDILHMNFWQIRQAYESALTVEDMIIFGIVVIGGLLLFRWYSDRKGWT